MIDYRISKSTPVHPADGMTAELNCGDGAYMTLINPQYFSDGGLEWVMRYGDPVSIRYTVASTLSSYDYLLSGNINMKEATRRLRLLRAARRDMMKNETHSGDPKT